MEKAQQKSILLKLAQSASTGSRAASCPSSCTAAFTPEAASAPVAAAPEAGPPSLLGVAVAMGQWV